MQEFQSTAGRKEYVVSSPMKVRDLIKMLNADVCRQVRMRGEAIGSFGILPNRATITVAGNDNIDIPPGTLASILKKAGLE